ncbi:MAG TPA: tRNA (adenosine(37)-N6)-threonylcarbamoyltransferase complex dimerization subunit type 1 TsaB [Bacteroidia bacterium]|nr:tRNA (adenosine(37)-N6)-threonylcarbamoyltransferase complex dimerization subunit type 1 TsaB [Bacteroidia bacterium]
MGTILNIETATTVCSVAISRNGEVIAVMEENSGFSHAEKLTRFIEHVCRQAKTELPQLDAIAVSSGPGSYTGLRIGVSTAKGICYALDKPLISVPTLFCIATGIRKKLFSERKSEDWSPEIPLPVHLIPMIDARRMEVYRAIYSFDLKELEKAGSEIISETSLDHFTKGNRCYFGGDGSTKLRTFFKNQDAGTIWEDILPSAHYLAEEAERKFNRKEFENTSLFEPFYLKEYVPGKPKAK